MLNEKLGVPEGINEQGEFIYQKIMDLVRKDDFEIPKKSDFENRSPVPISLGEYNIKIKDLETKCPFVLNFYYASDQVKDIMLYKLSYVSRVDFIEDKGEIMGLSSLDSSRFEIVLVMGDEATKESMLKVLENELEPSSIVHELMHLYSSFKQRKKSILDMANYGSFDIGVFPKKISDFIFLLYFTSSVESAVRASETYQMLLNDDVTKDNFLEYLKESKIIKNLTDAENFSIEQFKKELENDPEVDKFLKKIKEEAPEHKSVGTKADDILNILMITLISKVLEISVEFLNKFKAKNIMGNSLFSLFFGRSSGKIKEVEELTNRNFEKIINRYRKYENDSKKYFAELEKMLNFVGNKTKRKLYKLYDMVKEKENEKDSIVNWELHRKITSKNEKVTYTLDFESFKKRLKIIINL